MREVYDLRVQHDRCSSYYGKAQVIVLNDGRRQLKSYDTIVAEISAYGAKATVFATHSATTLRHIKEFLLQNGFRADTKNQIEGDYIKN